VLVVLTSLVYVSLEKVALWVLETKVPSGARGKQFVAELTRLFNAFALKSNLEAIALKAAMTLPSLMLQKAHAKSKTHEHNSCLRHRLSLWEKGDISNLLKEGRTLQKSLASSQPPKRDTVDDASTARSFSWREG